MYIYIYTHTHTHTHTHVCVCVCVFCVTQGTDDTKVTNHASCIFCGLEVLGVKHFSCDFDVEVASSQIHQPLSWKNLMIKFLQVFFLPCRKNLQTCVWHTHTHTHAHAHAFAHTRATKLQWIWQDFGQKNLYCMCHAVKNVFQQHFFFFNYLPTAFHFQWRWAHHYLRPF